jgi:hypothetical protein
MVLARRKQRKIIPLKVWRKKETNNIENAIITGE